MNKIIVNLQSTTSYGLQYSVDLFNNKTYY